MEPERVHALVLAAFMATIVMLPAVMQLWLGSRAANGRLKRNQWVGIRTPSTMRSDQAWVAGHRASMRLTPLYLLVTAVIWVALFAAAWYASTPKAVLLIGFAGFAVVIALALYTAYFASKAAKSADDHPEGPPGS